MALERQLRHVSVWLNVLQTWEVVADADGRLWLVHACQSGMRPPTAGPGCIESAPEGTTLADLLGQTISHRCPSRAPAELPPADYGNAV